MSVTESVPQTVDFLKPGPSSHSAPSVSVETENFLTLFTVLISSTVPRSEDHVFVKTGDIKNKTLPQFDQFTWVKDKKDNVVSFYEHGVVRFHSSFTDRVEFDNQTLSLTLKNMTKNNSGLYKETPVDHHNVLVIDPVDSPVLKGNVTIIGVNSCIMNVMCKTHALQLNTSYNNNNNNCSQEEVTSSRIETLTLYCNESVVVCNYSNQVSWRKATLEINQLCTTHEQDPEENNSPFPLYLLLVIIGVPVLVFTAVSVIHCFYKKPKKRAQQEERTVYDQVKPKNQVQKPLEMLEKSANIQTLYGFTGDPKEPRNTGQAMASYQTRTQTQPKNASNTIYSTTGQNQVPKETGQTIYLAVSKPSRGRKHVH